MALPTSIGTEPHQRAHEAIHAAINGLAGGTAGQQLVKLDGNDHRFVWANTSQLPYIDIDEHAQAGDVSASQAIARAIVAAKAGGIKVIRAKGAAYNLHVAVDFGGCNGITFEGAGKNVTVFTVMGTGSTISSVFHTGTTATTGLTFRDFTIQGDVVDDVTAPRRARTYSTSKGFNTAIYVAGDLAANGTYPAQRDIRVDSVRVVGARGLPIWLNGVRGVAAITRSDFHLTMDVGWTWCERAICVDNTSTKSADNGFSLSRGNQSVLVDSCMIDGANAAGVWVSGFQQLGTDADKGPSNFVVSNCVVRNVGMTGIHLDDAPRYGSVTGNLVNGVTLGSTDQPSNLWGVGIYVGGYPMSNRTTPTDFAYGINITGNTLVNCARGGVQVVAAKVINVHDNVILNPGSAFRADGTTAVASTDLDFNFGVAVMLGAQTTVTSLSVKNNTMVDDRATPLGNYPWYTSGSIFSAVKGNRQVGFRQGVGIIHDNTADNYSGINSYTASQKYAGGAVAGANAATGTILGFDINGAAGSVRPFRVQTGGVDRWLMFANADPESGSNAGSNLEISARNDAGVAVGSPLRFRRATAMTEFTRGTARARAVTTVSTNSAVTLNATEADSHVVALSANATSVTITNPTAGQQLTLAFVQDATGGRTYVWPTNCKFAGATAPTASTTAVHRDSVTFEYDGTNWVELYRAIAVR